MKILTAEQLRFADNFTIENLPISSIDLMERAASACAGWILQNIDKKHLIHIFCGPGNNGGDGLALARLLKNEGYAVKVLLLNVSDTLSPDCKTNFDRLKLIDDQIVDEYSSVTDAIQFTPKSILVDALFGTGLGRTLDPETANLVRQINASELPIISIDLPSGIYSDRTSLNTGYEIIKASYTLTFQYLKTGLLVPENAPFFGKVEVLNIGLMDTATDSMQIKTFVVDEILISKIFKPKNEFTHKGTFGHAVLIAGTRGKMGAAILSAQGYLRSGAGLLTMMVAENGLEIIQTAVPEAMAVAYHENESVKASLPEFKLSAIGAGPGLGTGKIAHSLVELLLGKPVCPLVLDADALNILAGEPEWYIRLPQNTILTPHPGEFKRLAGDWKNDFDKLDRQLEFSRKYRVFVVLKGKNTSIACPDGTLFFNPTGNAGMAKGGSGDILTGLLTGLIASGYSAKDACILGVYLHGLAGDLAAKKLTREGMNAGDIISHLHEAWKKVTCSE